jgi:hypothetical protein
MPSASTYLVLSRHPPIQIGIVRKLEIYGPVLGMTLRF